MIFFGSNISSKTQIASVIKQFEQAASSSPVKAPLLLEVDQEGGLVRRLPGAPLLSEKQIGQSSNPANQAASAGTNAGNNLLSVGMNVNLAPVVDFYRQAGDFYDQYQRSYSMSASTAGALSADFIRAQQATGVAATAKHFPGLASASSTQNTDLRPVTLNDSSDPHHQPGRTAIQVGHRGRRKDRDAELGVVPQYRIQAARGVVVEGCSGTAATRPRVHRRD